MEGEQKYFFFSVMTMWEFLTGLVTGAVVVFVLLLVYCISADNPKKGDKRED